MALVAPSILSADFGRLAEEARAVAAAGGDWLHIDVMDGHFVPPLTIGPLVVRALRRATDLPFDVHLMVDHPERLVEEFAKAGANRITVHVEAPHEVGTTLDLIRRSGALPGLALNPPTPLAAVQPYVDRIDLLLVMSVTPGWGGQSLVDGSIAKLAAARRLREDARARFLIEVDGGIKPANAGAIRAAGADVLVAGSAIFEAADYRSIVSSLRG